MPRKKHKYVVKCYGGCLRRSTETLNLKILEMGDSSPCAAEDGVGYKRYYICLLCLENRSWGILLKAHSPGLDFPFCHTVMCVAVMENVLRDTAR